MNRAFRALGQTLANRGMPYVALLTAIIVLLGAAGFYAFEKPPHGSLGSYPDALWCVAMITGAFRKPSKSNTAPTSIATSGD